MDDELAKAGEALREAKGRYEAARDAARALALEYIAAGESEYAVARRLGVDRMTVRKWQNKR